MWAQLAVVDADVVVIGAGALGLSTALHCALAGQSVLVVDRHTAGARASGRAAGLFKSVQACIEAGVLKGDTLAISSIVLSAAHGAASLLIAARFPFGSHRRYAEEVVATTLSGLQNQTIRAI